MRKSALLLFIVLLAFTIMPTTAQDACGDLAVRLQAGEGGRVLFTNGDPLNMRSAAGRGVDIVARLPEGEGFTVEEGPSYADDLRWWRVTAGATTARRFSCVTHRHSHFPNPALTLRRSRACHIVVSPTISAGPHGCYPFQKSSLLPHLHQRQHRPRHLRCECSEWSSERFDY